MRRTCGAASAGGSSAAASSHPVSRSSSRSASSSASRSSSTVWSLRPATMRAARSGRWGANRRSPPPSDAGSSRWSSTTCASSCSRMPSRWYQDRDRAQNTTYPPSASRTVAPLNGASRSATNLSSTRAPSSSLITSPVRRHRSRWVPGTRADGAARKRSITASQSSPRSRLVMRPMALRLRSWHAPDSSSVTPAQREHPPGLPRLDRLRDRLDGLPAQLGAPRGGVLDDPGGELHHPRVAQLLQVGQLGVDGGGEPVVQEVGGLRCAVLAGEAEVTGQRQHVLEPRVGPRLGVQQLPDVAGGDRSVPAVRADRGGDVLGREGALLRRVD